MNLLSRRAALIAASVAAAPIPAWARDLPAGAFTHGVASGDPTATQVILWTRFVAAPGAVPEIGWEVAEDEAFARVVARGRALARAANDHCAKVDVGGLRPGRVYYYRFLGAGGPSPTGITRTTPQGRANALAMALFSCSNYGFGRFHAYGHAAAREDVDLCVHVGDYIYEYGRDNYPSPDQTSPGRLIEPQGEIITLEDYYARYRTYRSDPDLQELHRLKPWVVVWDDHEIANNTWYDGARNHSVETEGAFAARFAAAWKAYLDWMPIRPPAGVAGRIHRSLEWGDLAGVALMDTRWFGRELQYDYADALAPVLNEGAAAQMAAVARLQAQINAPDRSLLGASQEAWLTGEMQRFQAGRKVWTVLAQQLVFAPRVAPGGLASLLAPDAPTWIRQFAALGAQLGAAGLEWNLDSWGGYPAARQRIVEACLRHADNAIILSGDSHNCWINDIPGGPDGRNAAIEVAGTSVSSPGLEAYFTNAAPGAREEMMTAANQGLAYCNMTEKGYAVVRLTRQAAETELVFFNDLHTPTVTPSSTVRLAAPALRGPGVGAWTVQG